MEEFIRVVVSLAAMWWFWRNVEKVIEARDLERHNARMEDREHLEDLFYELGTRIEQALSSARPWLK
jgi:hypothetical protein